MCIVQQSESYTAYDLPSSLLAFSVSSGMDLLVAYSCTRSMCVHVYLALGLIPPDGRLIRRFVTDPDPRILSPRLLNAE